MPSKTFEAAGALCCTWLLNHFTNTVAMSRWLHLFYLRILFKVYHILRTYATFAQCCTSHIVNAFKLLVYSICAGKIELSPTVYLEPNAETYLSLTKHCKMSSCRSPLLHLSHPNIKSPGKSSSKLTATISNSAHDGSPTYWDFFPLFVSFAQAEYQANSQCPMHLSSPSSLSR